MKIVRLMVLPLLILVTFAQAQTSAPAVKAPPQRADVAAAKMLPNGEMNAHFKTMHEKFLEEAKAGNIDVLFLGDSITEGWATKGKDVWKAQYEPMHAANFGIGGDKTQHVLWRIDNGELEGIKPKVCVLMIGTNNAGSNQPAQIADGITKIVQEVRDKTGAKVLLLAVFPRGATPDAPKDATVRAVVAKINAQIAKLDDGKNIRYLDISDKFMEPDKTITKEMMPDALHPTAKGYQIWADAMDPLLKEMMQ
jgi:lysophospholipase L1-like esterase